MAITIFLLALLTMFYFVPTIIAVIVKHNSLGAVVVLNFFLGWSMVGWVVALVWAIANKKTMAQELTQYEMDRHYRNTKLRTYPKRRNIQINQVKRNSAKS